VSGTISTNLFRWTVGIRAIANQIDRAALRTTITYKIDPAISVGVEYNPLAQKLSPLANWLVIPEEGMRPALVLGTSSDRIGTPSGQSLFATFSKSLEPELGLPISPYVGAAYGSFDDRFRPIGGLHLDLPHNLSAQLLFDGVHLHQMLSYSFKQHVFSFLLVRGHNPGLSYSISF
jgi:hypothetical protein